MVNTSNLDEIIKNCSIIKKDVSLPSSIFGYYCYDGDSYYILINKKILENKKIYRCVLAEEIGHYRTTIGDITPRKYMCYKDKLEIDKKERVALKWATEFLIPTNSLIDYIKDKDILSITTLTDYFCVTKDFIMTKFDFMSKQKHLWPLDKTRSLCLYNLPSVFIYRRF